MTKDLSKQICEKCGIKPISIAEYGATYIPHAVIIDGKIYPDFRQPDNFVKLMELPIKHLNKNVYTLGNIVLSRDTFSSRESFLQGLLGVLEYYIDFYEGMFKDIAQAIREAEWKYE